MLVAPAAANLRVPAGVHFSEDLEKAKAEAAEKGQGIVIVNTDHVSSNRTTNNRALAVMRALRSDAVVLLAPTQGLEATHNVNIPNEIRTNFRNRLMPGTPRVLLVDRELGTIVHRVLSADLAEDERGQLRELVEKARELAENQGLPAGAEPADPEMAEQAADAADAGEPATAAPAGAPDTPLNFQNFTNQDGNTIRAAVLALDGPTVRFRREDNVDFEYPLAQLSPESQQLVREALAATAEP